jgi:hypothetical protein
VGRFSSSRRPPLLGPGLCRNRGMGLAGVSSATELHWRSAAGGSAQSGRSRSEAVCSHVREVTAVDYQAGRDGLQYQLTASPEQDKGQPLSVRFAARPGRRRPWTSCRCLHQRPPRQADGLVAWDWSAASPARGSSSWESDRSIQTSCSWVAFTRRDASPTCSTCSTRGGHAAGSALAGLLAGWMGPAAALAIGPAAAGLSTMRGRLLTGIGYPGRLRRSPSLVLACGLARVHAVLVGEVAVSAQRLRSVWPGSSNSDGAAGDRRPHRDRQQAHRTPVPECWPPSNPSARCLWELVEDGNKRTGSATSPDMPPSTQQNSTGEPCNGSSPLPGDL